MNQSLTNTQYRAVIIEARSWLKDAFPTAAGRVDDMWPAQVRRAVDNGFEGGWNAFVSGTAELDPAYTGYDR